MSGFEITGIVLGGIPLIIAGLDRWRQTAEVCGYYRHIRKEHKKCLRNVQLYEILYKRNLEDLLRPIVDNPDDIPQLISDPGSPDWCDKALGERLHDRLQESYSVYMDIISDMNEAVEELKSVLCVDDTNIQSQLRQDAQPRRSSIFESTRTQIGYGLFRAKFSLNGSRRTEIFDRLEVNNGRLEKLLSTSEKVFALRDPKSTIIRATSKLEKVLNEARMKSELLFKALQKSWQCLCQQHHFANLKLEHRTLQVFCIPRGKSMGMERNSMWTDGQLLLFATIASGAPKCASTVVKGQVSADPIISNKCGEE